jgi:flavin reductase (DIM6/NTAB) family NADH-FMN oxidoreductase RutF
MRSAEPPHGPGGQRHTNDDGGLVSEAAIDPAIFRHVLGHHPTGVAVITALGEDGLPLALVVGTFTSVSLDPPLVGFLPDRKSSTWPLIAAAGRFAVNVLAADQAEECRSLAGRGDKFAGVDWSLSPLGLPVLANAVATIECELESVLDAGDHVFVLGRVAALAALREGDPMLFWRGRYGGFAG